jgi:hypothetical protein
MVVTFGVFAWPDAGRAMDVTQAVELAREFYPWLLECPESE